jgi:putative RecB family exonuclease
MDEALEAPTVGTAEEYWLEYWEANKARQRAIQGQDEASWRAGGRATKANPNKEDGNWWFEQGKGMVQNWINFRNGGNGWELWTTPEGKPAIELQLNIQLGGVPIKMALDRLMVTPDGELVVVDIKTGRSTPSSDFQLGIYACGIETVFGVRPKYGAYWAAREGITTTLVDLDKWSIERVGGIVKMFETARRGGIFIPNFDHCKMCNFTDECKYQNGDK